MKLDLQRHRTRWLSILIVAALLSLCLLLGYKGLSERAKLPSRPNLESVSPALESEVAMLERCLIYPWVDVASCWNSLGKLYHANRFYDEARVCYREALSAGFEQPEFVHYYLADIAKEGGDLIEARAQFSRTVSLFPDYLPALLGLAEVAAKSGEETAAVGFYRRVLKKDEGNPKALLELARVELRKGETEGALAFLLDLARSNPDYVEGISMLTQVLDTLGQVEKADAIRSQMSKRKPLPMEDPWMDSLLLSCFDTQRLSFLFEDYLKAGALEKSFVYLDRIQELDPLGSSPRMLRAYAYFQLKRYKEAVPHYLEAIRLGGDPANLHYYLSLCYFEEGQLDEAKKIAATGLRLAPDTADLMVVSADIALRKGNQSEAIEFFEQALSRDPAHLAANRSVSKLYWEMGDRESAIEHLEMVRTLQPSDLSSRMTLGKYYLDSDDLRNAVSVLEEASGIDPVERDVANLYSLTLMRLGNHEARNGAFESALSAYTQSCEIEPSREEAYLNKVKVLVHLARYEQAIETVQSLIALKPNDAVLRVSLGDLHKKNGDDDSARSCWNAAIAKAGDDKGLRSSIRERLKGLD